MNSQNKVAVVLHSGGLDSTVCLLLARESGREVISLGIDYGQRHKIEMRYAARQCRKFNISRRVLHVKWNKPLRQIPTGRTPDEMRSSVSSAFLPGRNVIFLALAAAEAAGAGASEIWIGVNAIDYSGYPDCSPEFVEAFKLMSEKAIPRGPSIETPLLLRSKAEIAQEAVRLGIRKGDTWSCYRPICKFFISKPCGRCDACILHETAWTPNG